MSAQLGRDTRTGRFIARWEGCKIILGCRVGFQLANLLPPSGSLVVTAGQTVGRKRDHGDQVVRTGRSGRAVCPTRRGLMVFFLDKHLRADAVDAVEEWIKRAKI